MQFKYSHGNTFGAETPRAYIRAKKGVQQPFTVAMQCPESEEEWNVLFEKATEAINSCQPFPAFFGLAVVHPCDQFNKRVGRELAEKNASAQEIEVCSVIKYFDREVVNFWYAPQKGDPKVFSMCRMKNSGQILFGVDRDF